MERERQPVVRINETKNSTMRIKWGFTEVLQNTYKERGWHFLSFMGPAWDRPHVSVMDRTNGFYIISAGLARLHFGVAPLGLSVAQHTLRAWLVIHTLFIIINFMKKNTSWI